MDRIGIAPTLLLHLGLCVLALIGFVLIPPAKGRMLLLPLGSGSGDALQIALGHGAGLVGRGPIAGSLIISGELSRLAAPLRAVGAILLAAPGDGCGEGRP